MCSSPFLDIQVSLPFQDILVELRAVPFSLPGHPGWVEKAAPNSAFLDIQVGLPFQDILVRVEALLIGDQSHVTPLNMCCLSLFDACTDGIGHQGAALLDLWVFIENIQINLILVVIHCGRKGGYL